MRQRVKDRPVSARNSRANIGPLTSQLLADRQGCPGVLAAIAVAVALVLATLRECG